MSKENKTAIKITLAYLSFIVGAGFTTVQELLQFFVNHGNYAYIAAIITGIIVTFGTRQTSKVGYRLDANQYDISLHSLFGKVLGTIINYLIVLLLFFILLLNFNNPFAFEKEPREHTSKELLDLLRLHLTLFDKYATSETRQFKSLRRFFKIYVRSMRGASELRHQLMSTETTDEVRALLDEFEAQMEDVVES
ncbi:hypothetical protein DV527_00210 [Staphylococcus saprophyticus]|nr:hypothetical protein DV527_00210 [Staphylococcus saprophyticus]